MANLGQSLRETIKTLEQIRDKQNPPAADILDQIDQLYDKQIDLVNAAINQATVLYAEAAEAMEEAAKKAKEELDALGDLEKRVATTAAVAKAIAKIVALIV